MHLLCKKETIYPFKLFLILLKDVLFCNLSTSCGVNRQNIFWIERIMLYLRVNIAVTMIEKNNDFFSHISHKIMTPIQQNGIDMMK